MKFQCLYCLSAYQVEKEELGDSVVCSNCKKKNIIPGNAYGQRRIIGGDFSIERLLGAGGMGSVYLVNQISLNRKVALKVLLEKYSADEKYRTAFIKEARSVAGLRHVNLTQIYAFGKDGDDALYLGLEYVDGKTVGNILEEVETISISNALKVVDQVASGLSYAWTESEIVHRDIKPDNILVGSEGVIKLTDMGLARKAEELASIQEVSGTPSYISPEQLLKRPVNFRSDMYSLGIVLYQCIVGKLPFISKSIKEIAKMHVKQPITFAEDSKVPKEIKKLIVRMTAKRRDDRFESYAELREHIKKD